MKTKRFLYVLVLIMIAVCMLSFTACKKNNNKDNNDDDQSTTDDTQQDDSGNNDQQGDSGNNNQQGGSQQHTHQYTSAVTNPTCTAKGYTTYTCSCGHSYQGNEVNATGHSLATVSGKAATCKEAGYTEYKKCANCDYTEGKTTLPVADHNYTAKVTKYPTLTEAGARTLTCDDCDKVVNEEIEAYATSLPSVTDALYIALDGAKYTFDGTDSDLIYLTNANGNTVEERTLTLQLAEIVLDGSGDEVVGYAKFEIGLVVESNDPDEEYDGLIVVYVYVNGDVISTEVTLPDQPKEENEFVVNEILFGILAEEFGADPDDLASGAFVINELERYIPVLAGLIEEIPTLSEEFITSVNSIASLVGDDIVDIEEKANGNTVYTLDLAALNRFFAIVEGKTISDIIDDMYGEGTGDAIFAFVASVPDKKIGDIVDAVLAITESYDISKNDVYYLINVTLQLAGFVDFDISEEITARYNMTVAEVIAELEEIPEEEVDAFADVLKQQIVGVATMILGSTVDELYNLFSGSEDEEFSIIDFMKEMVEMLDEQVVATAEFDADGALVSANVSAPLDSADLTIEVTNDDGVIRADLEIVEDEKTILDVQVTVDEAEGNISYEIEAYGDHYYNKPMEDEYGNILFDEDGAPIYESVYIGYGMIAEILGNYAWNDGGWANRVIINAYDEWTGEMDEELNAQLAYQNDETGCGVIAIINGATIAAVHSYETESIRGNIAFGMLQDDYRVFVVDLYYASDVEEDAIVGYEIEGEVFADDEKLMEIDAYIDLVEVEGEATVKVFGVAYDETTYQSEYKQLGTLTAALTTVTDGKKLVMTVLGADGVEKVADFDLVLKETTVDNKQTISLDFDIEIEGEQATGTYTWSVTTLDDGVVIERAVSATIDGDETVESSEKITLTENGISYEITAEVDGVEAMDALFALEYETEEGKEIITLSYDIGKFVTGGYTMSDGTNTVEYEELITGEGEFVLTIER